MTDNRDNITAPDTTAPATSSSAIAVDERDATVAERGFFTRLYTGSGGIDVIGKRRTWYWVTAVALLVCIGAMVFRGFTLGIDFEGGTRMTMPPANVTEEQAEEVFEEATGVTPDLVQIIGAATPASWRSPPSDSARTPSTTPAWRSTRSSSRSTPPASRRRTPSAIPRSPSRGAARSPNA